MYAEVMVMGMFLFMGIQEAMPKVLMERKNVYMGQMVSQVEIVITPIMEIPKNIQMFLTIMTGVLMKMENGNPDYPTLHLLVP